MFRSVSCTGVTGGTRAVGWLVTDYGIPTLLDDIACAKMIRDTPHCAVGGCGIDQWWVQNKLE